jgi:nitrate reductase gamma subunit
MRDAIFHILFVWYPYVCISAFVFGSLIRFDREQYTWRASSSQMLRKRQLAWGSNLFHFGILFLFFGHIVGLLTPKAIYTLVMTPAQKQMIAIVAGGIAGAVCFVGLTLLLHRRLFDARIRQTSTYMDLAVLGILWVQLVLGLVTLPFSLTHTDG